MANRDLWGLRPGEEVAFLTKPKDMDMDAFMAEVNEMVVKANDYGWPHQVTMAVINGWMILQAQRREGSANECLKSP